VFLASTEVIAGMKRKGRGTTRGVDAAVFLGHERAVAMHRVLLCLFFAACAAPEVRPEETQPSAATSAEPARCRAPDPDWRWRKLGAVIGLPEAERAGDGVLTPALVEHDGALHLWFTQKTGVDHVLFHSESRDGGETFATPSPATGLGEGRVNAYPTVWRENGAFKLLFGSGSIKLATSDDGVHFTLAPSSVLSASFAADRFDALSVLYPNRVSDEARFGAVLFFSGYDGRHVRIGRAVEQADGRFAVDPPRPVVDLGAADEFDNAAVAQPHVQRAFGQWWMFYGGYDTSHTNPGPYRIGSASSADGVVWNKHGVAVELSESGSDAWSTRDPALVPWPGGWLMFYVGLGDDGRYRLHRAASDVCSSGVR
jgi:hypothetical protein